MVSTDELYRAPLYKGHHEVYRRMFGKKVFALYADLGTCKTYMLLADFLAAWQADMVDGVLVIAPTPKVARQWLEQEWIQATTVKYDGGVHPDCDPPLQPSKLPRIFVVHKQAFARKGSVVTSLIDGEKTFKRGANAGSKLWKRLQQFLKSGRIGLIIDESQMIKNARSSVSRRVRTFKPLAAYRRNASGFPNPLGLIDFYNQYAQLNTKILGCTTKSQFEDKFCVKGGFKGKQIVGYKNEDEFERLVAPYTHTCKIEDWADMPKRSHVIFPVELTREQERLIKQIKTEFRAVLRESTLNMPMALQRITRTQQIACGYLPILDDQGRLTGQIQTIKENRTEALEEQFSMVRGKVIVWCTHAHCIDRLTKHFNEKARVKELGGYAVKYRGTDHKTRDADLERFKHDPKCRFLFAIAKSLGEGINGLTVSRYTFYWDNNHNRQERRQTERRIWRTGQSQACVYGDFCAKGTYDEKICNALINGMSVSDAVLKNIARWADV